ncbi:MAG TPA: hypothetical protein VHB25_11550, partial [Gemmatimonadaceae bacterium]|nr:hypothetical protein [Gemmatimonadaceae bacterium]
SATNPLVRVVVRGPSTVALNVPAPTSESATPIKFGSGTTGTLTSGSATVTQVADVSVIEIGQSVDAPGVALGTTVTAIDAGASTITLSAAASQSTTGATLAFYNTTTGTTTQGSTLVTGVPAGAVPVRVGQVVSGAGLPSGAQVVGVTNACYAASSSVGPPTAFYAPPVPASGTNSIALRVEVWCSPGSYYDKGATPAAPDHAASITVSADTDGNLSWTIDSDPSGVMVPYDATNPFRIAVAAPA